MDTGNQTNVPTTNTNTAYSGGILAKVDTKQYSLAVLCCVNSPGVILTKAYGPLFARATRYQMTAALDYQRVLSDSDVLLIDRFGVGMDDDHVFYDFIAQNKIPYVICNSSDCALDDRLQRNKWLNEILGRLYEALQSIQPIFDANAEYQRGLENLAQQFGKHLVEEVLANRGDLPLHMPDLDTEPNLDLSMPTMEGHGNPEATIPAPSRDEAEEIDLSNFGLDVDTTSEAESEAYDAESAGTFEPASAVSFDRHDAASTHNFEQPIVDAVFDDAETSESLDVVAPAETDHHDSHRVPTSSVALSYAETSSTATPPPVHKPSSSDKLADIFSEIKSYTEDKRIAAILENLPMQDYSESQNDKPIVTAEEFTFDYTSMEAYAQERARLMQATRNSDPIESTSTVQRQAERRQGRPEFQIHAKQAQEDLAQLFTKGELSNGNLKSWLNNVVTNKKRKKK